VADTAEVAEADMVEGENEAGTERDSFLGPLRPAIPRFSKSRPHRGLAGSSK
jgi:hypothetical protein